MRPILIGIILAMMALLAMQACVSVPASGMLTADEKGLVFVPTPISPMQTAHGIIVGFAMAHCASDPKFRGCADIFCQEDINHPHCTEAAIKRLKKKGVLR